MLYGIMRAVCGCGGIGRHNRLKICRLNGRAGSIPATRTITEKRRNSGAFFMAVMNVPAVVIGKVEENGKKAATKLRSKTCASTPKSGGDERQETRSQENGGF